MCAFFARFIEKPKLKDRIKLMRGKNNSTLKIISSEAEETCSKRGEQIKSLQQLIEQRAKSKEAEGEASRREIETAGQA